MPAYISTIGTLSMGILNSTIGGELLPLGILNSTSRERKPALIILNFASRAGMLRLGTLNSTSRVGTLPLGTLNKPAAQNGRLRSVSFARLAGQVNLIGCLCTKALIFRGSKSDRVFPLDRKYNPSCLVPYQRPFLRGQLADASKRSRVITLVQASTKSLTNFSCESSAA